MMTKAAVTKNSAIKTELPVQPKNLYIIQLCNKLKNLANEEYHLMLKIKFLADALRKPAFKEIIDSAEASSDTLMVFINHLLYHIRELEGSDVSMASLVQASESKSYSGWVDRVKEIISIHQELKQQIVTLFVTFKSEDFPETFEFLKQTLAVHEDQLWHFRHQIEK